MSSPFLYNIAFNIHGGKSVIEILLSLIIFKNNPCDIKINLWSLYIITGQTKNNSSITFIVRSKHTYVGILGHYIFFQLILCKRGFPEYSLSYVNQQFQNFLTSTSDVIRIEQVYLVLYLNILVLEWAYIYHHYQ